MFPERISREDLLLSLLNTTPVVDGVQQDLLATKDGRNAWFQKYADDLPDQNAKALLEGRAALQEVVRGHRSPSTLATHLGTLSYTAQLTDDGVDWVPAGGSRPSVLATAILTWDGLQNDKPGRLRPCANPECALFLIDHSKANTARWCSMAVCGNRMKARRHYQRGTGSRSQV
jgi:hypothetical protein